MGVHYLRGTTLYQSKKFAAALPEFQQDLAEFPLSSETAAMIACCLDATNQIDQALHWAREAVRLDPESSFAFHMLGRTLYRSEGYISRDVLQSFTTAMDLDPNDLRSCLYLAKTYGAHSKWKKALKIAQVGMNCDPLDADCLATVGWSKFHLGETIEAEQLLLKSLSVEPLVASTHHYLAYIAIFKQDIALAREHITQAHRIDPQPFTGEYIDSHDRMSEILKADGTFYGKVLSLSMRWHHAASVFEELLGGWYPPLLISASMTFRTPDLADFALRG